MAWCHTFSYLFILTHLIKTFRHSPTVCWDPHHCDRTGYFQLTGWESVLRTRDIYPGSRISDPRSKNSNKREGWKKCCCHNFFFSLKCHKIEHYFSFEVLEKKIWANFPRIIELFPQKIVTKLSKIWVRDQGSGKNLFRIPDPGVKKAPDPGSGSATLVRIWNIFTLGKILYRFGYIYPSFNFMPLSL